MKKIALKKGFTQKKKYNKIKNDPTLAAEGLEIRKTGIREVQVEGLE